jgi:hypothetical protein
MVDLLITDDGKVDRVVLSVRGRRQLVAVPFGQLRFVPSRSFRPSPLGRRGTALLAQSGTRFGVIPRVLAEILLLQWRPSASSHRHDVVL